MYIFQCNFRFVCKRRYCVCEGIGGVCVEFDVNLSKGLNSFHSSPDNIASRCVTAKDTNFETFLKNITPSHTNPWSNAFATASVAECTCSFSYILLRWELTV